MNIFLPNKKEITPIKESWSTFYESGFNDDFDKMPFKSKLQIVTDIIRQTILYEEYPNPEVELLDLTGDSYTATKILVNYLKELKLGSNIRIVLCKDYKFEQNQFLSTHFIVLLDNNGVTYQLDCTPSTGYKCGQVEDINKDRFYNTYIEINNKIDQQLKNIRTILYRINYENIDDNDIPNYLKILNDFSNDDVLSGYIYKCYKCLFQLTKDKQKKQIILNNCSYKRTDEKYISEGIIYVNENSFIQIQEMRKELAALISEDKDYRRQLEIAQCIIYELIKYNKQFDKKLILGNKQISYININPRLFLELGLNVVLLKPSSFKSGTSSVIKNKYLKNSPNIIGEYYPNLGMPSEKLGLKPMRLFHPCGYQYERSMYGPGDLFLVKQKADNIKTIKKELRRSLARELDNTKLIWYDGEEIIWDPVILNLVHTTDDPSEASLHYLAGYPEYQLMTRFMYPNPKLKVLEKVR